MKQNNMFSKIQRLEFILIVVFYLIMALFYYITLSLDIGRYPSYWAIVFNFGLKALITLPFWWLFFSTLATLSIFQKTLLHLITLPIFIVIWLYAYYWLCDLYGIFRSRDSRMVWDVYITALFYIIQFGNFHLYDYYKKLQEQQLIAVQLGKLNLQSELSALKAQLNPHFLYNVFNTINAAIPKTAKPARDMVNKLSDLFRYQLKASRAEFVTLKEELDFIEKYLDLEKERFGDRLTFKIDVSDLILEEKVPPMIFQPIIENAIKHGISPQIAGGGIITRIRKISDQLQVMISDTGIGINGQDKNDLLNKGVGLSNTDERLRKMYGKGLELIDNHPKGLIVKCTIPLNTATEHYEESNHY